MYIYFYAKFSLTLTKCLRDKKNKIINFVLRMNLNIFKFFNKSKNKFNKFQITQGIIICCQNCEAILNYSFSFSDGYQKLSKKYKH